MALRDGGQLRHQGQKKAKNHNNLFDIEVQFEGMVRTLEKTEINADGLFINAGAGFDSQKLRDKSESKGIIAIFVITNAMAVHVQTIILMKNCIKNDIPLNAPTLGWIVSVRF